MPYTTALPALPDEPKKKKSFYQLQNDISLILFIWRCNQITKILNGTQMKYTLAVVWVYPVME